MTEGGQGSQWPQNNDYGLLSPSFHSTQLRWPRESTPTPEEMQKGETRLILPEGPCHLSLETSQLR